jgi:biotin carboxylase
MTATDPLPTLAGMSEVRAYLRTNPTPVYFISPTAFNLLGIDRWMRNLYSVTYYDSFENSHPRVFVPRERPYREFQSIEEICNYLLGHKEVVDFVHMRGGGKAAFVMFDEETERLAGELGLDIIHPPATLRKRLDSKIVTTQLGNEAGVPSVPNVLARATTYRELLGLAAGAGLGDDLVVQTPYGDSGRTTYFLRGERDWDDKAEQLSTQELKVMRRITPLEVCVEAVITQRGTIVGPFVASLIGRPELTPYKGGWCGNDIYPDVLSDAQHLSAIAMTQRLGARLAQDGYRGFFEVDYLLDADGGELYLGEINPRVSGLTPITHVTLGAYSDIPLFLFHVLEYLGIDYRVDVDELNQRWFRLAADDVWSQLIIKEPEDRLELLTATPRTGVWRIDDNGNVTFERFGHDWHSLVDESEAFYLRVAAPGDYRYKGADLGVLVTRGRMGTQTGELTERCRRWIEGMRGQFAGTSIKPRQDEAPPAGVMAFKGS